MTSRIVQLNVRNFLGIEAVQIEPDGNVVVINGANGSGKTSILTAIWAMLASKAGLKDIDEPVHAGAKTAVIEGVIDLGDGEGLRITRTFSATSGMKIKVTTLDGENIGGPETALKKLFTAISFDPLAFSKMKPKEQVEVYLRAANTELDLSELNVKRAEIYDQRTEVNREADTAQKTLEGLPFTAADPDAAEVSGASILAEQQAAQDQITRNGTVRFNLEQKQRLMEDALQRVNRLRVELDEARQQYADLDAEVDGLRAAEEHLGSDPDLTEFAERLTAIEETNREIRLAKQRHALSVAGIDAAGRAAELTAKLDEIDQQKRAAIAAIPQIVPGLTFDEEGMFLNGTPLAQASGSERLLVSCQVGIALNPEVRVMTMQDGPLLDTNSMRLLDAIAEEHDFQVWVERQEGTDADGVGFTISEGKLTGRPVHPGSDLMEGAILAAAAMIDANALNGSPGTGDEYIDAEDDEAAVDAFFEALDIDASQPEPPVDDAPPIWEGSDEF